MPDGAFDALNGGYQPQDDDRDPRILEICEREGRDPEAVGVNAAGSNTAQLTSIEVANQGSLDLDPETSRSFTTGIAVADNFGAFDMSFNVNYYSIIVEDSIAELTAQYAIDECYLDDDDVRSVFCDQIRYSSGERALISQAFPTFLNQDKETVRGLDFNATFGYEFPMGGDVLDLGLNLRANHLIERSTLFVSEDGEDDFDEETGEFGFPRWTGRAIGTVGYGDFMFTWQTRWIGKTSQAASGVDEFSDVFGRGPDGEPTGFNSDTCLGNGSGTYDDVSGVFTPDGVVVGDGVFCRDVGYADDYFVHTISMRYEFSDFITLRAGVTNLFDEAPPLIDTNEVFGVSNISIGNGYDLDGREFFGSISIRF